MNKQKRVWNYARTARNENGAIEYQMAQLEAYSTQNDYKIIGASQDIGSGLTLDHAGLYTVKNMAAENKIDAVLVTCVDRINRSNENIRTFQEAMNQYGVDVIALDGSVEFITPKVSSALNAYLNNSSELTNNTERKI